MILVFLRKLLCFTSPVFYFPSLWFLLSLHIGGGKTTKQCLVAFGFNDGKACAVVP
ncbi:hypothetical protein [Agriterribacter sp.]|uniref:hypothetical protein n=1 Tax=Agriterribacter sp. TaxID=2821509 RepID=UPI002CEB1276|nr:hypothetical protein [Agriterribacter sp.]HRP56924.1 hypothetical protein [Agriterribacter sp.]